MNVNSVTWHGVPLRHVALTAMSIQNALAALIMHYSRVMPVENPDERYFSSTAVLLSELLKLTICLICCQRDQSMIEGKNATWSQTILDNFSKDSWKLAIPALLYTLQNNLQYYAISNLDAATFQVTYQLKILTTAFFAIIILQRRLAWSQWGSLMLLTIGVALVSISPGHETTTADSIDQTHVAMNSHLGLLAVLIACTFSGLAGVYFEKILKTSQHSLWSLNVQLSFFSIFPAFFLGVMAKDGAKIMEKGFFCGYNIVVFASIIVQAIGGLIVAMCVLYADNITKNFATSIAVLLSALASVFLFNFVITINFVVGSCSVLLATYIYGLPETKPADIEM